MDADFTELGDSWWDERAEPPHMLVSNDGVEPLGPLGIDAVRDARYAG